MWFGSYNGLHKHEGTSIKVYKRSGKDSASLSSKEMHAVFEDRLGFIWAGTTGGLDKLDPKTGIILHYKLRSPRRKDDYIGYIVSIFQDDRDAIWIETNVGLFVMEYLTGKYSLIPDEERSGKGIPANNLYYKSAVKTDSGIWMYSSGYFVFYDFKTRQFIHQFNNPGHKRIFSLLEVKEYNGGSELCGDSAGNLYFIVRDSVLMKYNILTEKLDSFSFRFPKNAWHCCFSLAVDHHNNVWIGFRYGGLLLFNNDTKQFTPIRHENANSLIRTDWVYSLSEDYLDRMWVTTDDGIFIIDYYDHIVQQRYLSDKKEFININYAAGIISQDTKGNIYVPFFAGGLFSYNIFSGNSRYFPVDDKANTKYDYVFTGESNNLYISINGALLLWDTASQGMRLGSPVANRYRSLTGDPTRMGWIFKRNDRDIYFKKQNGLIYHYNGTDQLEKIQGIGFSRQLCVSKDSNFLFYLDQAPDLVRRNLQTARTDTFFLTKKLEALNFSFINTRDIADDGKGNIWVTSQNGLIKYTLSTKEVAVYTTSDGLLHDFSFTLCADSKNRLWVGSMGGVNLYDAQTNRFINVFPESPDKLSNYFGSSLEAKDGHIYFLFGGKLVNINPDGFLKRVNKERLLHLNEIQVNGHITDQDELSGMSHRQNRISFRFGLLEFAEPEKVNYSYWLQGSDMNWIDLGNRSEVTFNTLQPGKYVLHVKATDVYGNPVKNTLDIPFTIKKPFWKTWWFITTVSIALVLFIYLIVKKRENNIKITEEEKLKAQKEMYTLSEQLSKAKLEALRSQMNPHFIFNSLNAIQECIVTNKVDAAYEYLSKFSRLQRMVLNNSEKELISLGSEIEMLHLYLSLESLRFSESFSYTIDTSGLQDINDTMIPSLIIQPIVENAIWHGLRNKEGIQTLTITYQEEKGQLFVTVEDNGIGREEAASIRKQKLGGEQFASRGTSILQQRLSVLSQQLNADIQWQTIDKKDENGHATGTKVIISFPSNLETDT
jgi:ligand-binding sensor domain-containing protein